MNVAVVRHPSEVPAGHVVIAHDEIVLDGERHEFEISIPLDDHEDSIRRRGELVEAARPVVASLIREASR